MGTPLTRDVEQVLDLANHASVGATARLQQEGGAVRLVANYALERGDEVSLCYDADADHLDLFERYGFFDATSVVHTAEVRVPEFELWAGGGEGGEGWRRSLVAAQAARGYDDELEVRGLAPAVAPPGARGREPLRWLRRGGCRTWASRAARSTSPCARHSSGRRRLPDSPGRGGCDLDQVSAALRE